LRTLVPQSPSRLLKLASGRLAGLRHGYWRIHRGIANEIYREIWGENIHMGIFETPDESLQTAMDRSNAHELVEMAPSSAAREKVRLFREFDPRAARAEKHEETAAWIGLSGMDTTQVALIAGGVMIVLLLMGYPMMVPLIVGALVLMFASFATVNPATLVQQMIGGVEQSVLVAVPMFILAADIMIKGHTAERLLDFTGARVSASELLTDHSWGVGSWKERLSRRDHGDVHEVARNELSRLGYL
jgi:hypothetical protein